MGKYSQYAKRGSAQRTGYLNAPQGTNWHFSGPGATSVNAHLDLGFPAGADAWGVVVQLAAGGAFVGTQPVGSGTPLNITGLVTATNYQGKAAWYKGTVRISDFSAAQTFTTL